MSRFLVTQYQAEVKKIIQYGGSRNETAIRGAFQNLLNEYCKTRNYLLIPELEYKTKFNTVVNPDGTVKDAIRLEHGWWESKDQYDNLDEEIEKKFAKGYPDENILFEDSQTAVLIQHREEVARVPMKDADGLDSVLSVFIDYERPEVRDFRAAIVKFKEDIPYILEALRDIISQQEDSNTEFRNRRDKFLNVCQQSINPEISIFDIHEMLIQHILTEDIFTNIFNESQFHRENNIAREISEIINAFFTGATRRNALKSIEHYYAVIRRKSGDIANHHEKQKFLKAVYENFYKAYNPKAADRLGIVYTPNEIVRFMIESADYLVHKHFGKLLSDPGVKILDPCTGTGTYLTELIEYLPLDKLEHKYKNEIYCNEVAILPYYIANLNIEFTYQQKMGRYEEFKNICLVDTLDHCGFEGKQLHLFAMSVQNTARIQEQNNRMISVIIGNPPYNANQERENDNNRNRYYDEVDNQIRKTYVAESTAQKMKIYDMYARFFRWATSRLDENGVLVFITNSSFINARGFDGFRKVVAEEFSDIYVIDLGGDVRKNPKLSGTKHNVFGIQAGVAISFMVKQHKNGKSKCKIFYSRRPEFDTAEQKLEFLYHTKFEGISFKHISPDKYNNWLDQAEHEFDDLIRVCSKEARASDDDSEVETIFKLYSIGISTNRDEWVYDFDAASLEKKAKFFMDEYNHEVDRWKKYKQQNKYADIKKESNPVLDKFLEEKGIIKWIKMIKRDKLRKDKKADFKLGQIARAAYRPYCARFLYFDYIPIDIFGNQLEIFGADKTNCVIACNASSGGTKPFGVLATNQCVDLHLIGDTICIPLYRYDENGKRIDNISDWGLTQFQTHYNNPTITKENIFHYTYAVLHHPAYRKKYELNVKREFPRLPFYDNFAQWVQWGKQLMDLHLNYETIEPYGLTRTDANTNKQPKAKLKADKDKGYIDLDGITFLQDIPAIAWDYKLGNRSALEWILDQYKEKKPKDPTIAKLFNTYRFADYKEHVIDLLQRVCTVSVETMEIIGQMPDE